MIKKIIFGDYQNFKCLKSSIYLIILLFFRMPFVLRSFLDVLLEAAFLSVDPYMRPYSERIPVGVTMIGSQIAK